VVPSRLNVALWLTQQKTAKNSGDFAVTLIAGPSAAQDFRQKCDVVRCKF
jgi:hypothetical protein